MGPLPGGGIVATDWTRDSKRCEKRLHALSADEDWEVREWAAGGLADVLARDFKGGMALCETWVKAEEEAPCRAVALALSACAKKRNAKEAAPMLAIIARLLPLDGAYLQKNLGPFAIGGGFLSRFPKERLSMLRRASKKRDENTRWNVAMAFTAAAARKYSDDGAKIPGALETDDRPRIVRAVAKARKNLSR